MIVVQLVIGFIVICLQCEVFTQKSLMHSAFPVFGEEVKAKNGKSLSLPAWRERTTTLFDLIRRKL